MDSMRVSPPSVPDSCAWGRKLASCRGNTFGLLQFRRLALPCLSSWDADSSSSDGSGNESPSPSSSVMITERCTRAVDGMTYVQRIGVSSRKKYSFKRCWHNKEEMLNQVALVLQNQHWDLGFPKQPKVEFNESNVSLILNKLFDGSLDAALAFFFFRWSQRHNGSKHGIRPVCTMIHISVLGNMNHIAVKFICDLVQSIRGGCHESLFHVLKETSKDRKALETVYSMLVGYYINEGVVDVALKLIDYMKVLGMYPATGVLVTLLKRLLESKNLELALSIFAEAQYYGRDISKRFFSLLIHYCCIRGNLAYAYKLFSNMHNYGCKPDIVSYTMIIDALYKKGLFKVGSFLLSKLVHDDISPDCILISSMVNGYCKAGRFVEAMNILKALHCTPDEFIFNSFICKLCNEGSKIDATRLFIEMSEGGAFHDCCNWNTVIAEYCKANQIYQALKFLGGMLKRGLKPTVSTYTVLIECYCKFGDVQEAEYLLNTMRKDGLRPDVIAYNALIHGHGKKGMIQKVLESLDVMKADGISLDVVTYNILIHVLVKGGFLMEAREVLSELTWRGYSPDKFTYTSMINGLFEKGNFQEAFRMWCHMNKSGTKPDVVSCTVLLDGFCKAHLMPEAYALFHKMLEAGLAPDLALYNALICGFCREGDVQEACQLLNMMVEANIIPNDITYRALIRGFKKNRVNNCKEVAAIKIHQALATNNIFVDESFYVTLGVCEE